MSSRVTALNDCPGPGSQIPPRLGAEMMRHDAVNCAYSYRERRGVLRRSATAAGCLVLSRR